MTPLRIPSIAATMNSATMPALRATRTTTCVMAKGLWPTHIVPRRESRDVKWDRTERSSYHMASTPERWSRVKAIFDAAIAVAPPARPAFVAEACGGDEDLRAEVFALLAGHDGAAGFLETP